MHHDLSWSQDEEPEELPEEEPAVSHSRQQWDMGVDAASLVSSTDLFQLGLSKNGVSPKHVVSLFIMAMNLEA